MTVLFIISVSALSFSRAGTEMLLLLSLLACHEYNMGPGKQRTGYIECSHDSALAGPVMVLYLPPGITKKELEETFREGLSHINECRPKTR